VTTPGNISKALDTIKSAGVPVNVNQDFVKTILKIPGGSGDQITSYLKKIGLANTDGTPSEIYKKFRNPTSSGAAIAQSIKKAYAPLYVRNEYMHELSDDDLLGLVVEETGQPHDSNPVKLIVSCIQRLKGYADFSNKFDNEVVEVKEQSEDKIPQGNARFDDRQTKASLGLNLGYTINLNLPATTDPAVFDAIFKSLKENLLTEDDA
jgi:hypothetical protein